MHTVRTITTTVVGAAAGLAAVAALAAPAAAEGVRLTDPDDTDGGYDVSRAVVRHGAERLFVKVTFDDLTRNGGGGMSVFIDTDPALRGPEFRVGAGLFEGTDFNIGTMTGWRNNDDVLSCASDLRLDYRRETATYWVERDCFDDVEELRVGIKVADDTPGSTDWVTGRRSFTDWLVAG